MELFRNRPLFLLCTVFLGVSAGGMFVFRDGSAGLRWALFGGLAIACVAAAGIIGRLLWRKRQVRRATVGAIALLLTIVALMQSYGLFAGKQTRQAEALAHKTVNVTAVVTDRRGSGGYLSSFALSPEAVDGESLSGTILLTCHYPADLRPGDMVEITAMALSLEEVAGDGYDATALRGDGYVLGLVSETEDDLTILRTNTEKLPVKAGLLRRTLAARLNLLADGAFGLPSAFLLGDKVALDDTVRRNFARAGVSHLLAISGLHMTLLFGLSEGILCLLRVPKRIRAILLAVLSLAYLILLGFPPSATRAVLMLGVTYLSTLLSARADALTSLGLAGALIVAATPYAVCDAGFWMSYLATFGLLTLAPILQSFQTPGQEKDASLPMRGLALIQKLAFGLGVGILAMTFTLFIVAAVIGEIGILSPLSTVILTPLCGGILLLSPIALCLFGTAAGDVIGSLIRMIGELMARITASLAEPSWAVISLRHPAVLPLAVGMLVALVVLLSMKIPKKRRSVILLPVLVGWALIGGLIAVENMRAAERPMVSFVQPSSQSDALVLAAGGEGFICDLSNGSLTALRGAMLEAERQGATELAVLMLTHYHSRTASSLGAFFAQEKVRTLWVPYPADAEEYSLLSVYWEKAAAAGVTVSVYRPGDLLTLFGSSTLTLQTSKLKRSVQPVLLLGLDTCPAVAGKGEVVYCGSAVFESELAEEASALVSEADTVIFGNHGPLPKQAFGEALSYRTDVTVTVILSREGDVAGYFDPSALPADAALWWGQKRLGRD